MEFVRFFQGDDQPAAFLQLADERGRDLPGRAGDDDGVEGGLLDPAEIAVIALDLDVGETEGLQRLPGFLGQGHADLDAVDAPGQPGEDGRLIAGTRAYFQDLVGRMQLEALGHQGHDIRLGDGLALVDGQGIILVGLAAIREADEQVTGDLAHDLQDAGVLDVAGAELDVDHGLPLFGEKSPFVLSADGAGGG